MADPNTTICPDCPDTGDCRANGCIKEIGAAVAPIVPIPTYHHPGPNCDGSGHRTCPYSQWAEGEIQRLRGIVRVNLLRHVPGATHAAIDALLDGGAIDVC